MKALSLVSRWLKWILAAGAGFLVVGVLFGLPNGGGLAFWESAEPPSITNLPSPPSITMKDREYLRSLIEEGITDMAASDGVRRPSAAEWDALCEGLAVVDGDMDLLEVHVDGQRLGWLARGMAEIFGNVDAFAEGKGLPPYTPAMFCEDM